MPLTPGQTLSSYEILALLGKGGMGEVYRARDPKLDRDVAIKVLPEEFATDEERLLRFRREAKLLASLEHSNIAAIYGFETIEVEDGEAIHFLVLEYVEGMSLSQRLENGPLPVDEALEFCERIAEGLESAHEKGIVHRDLKPGNVMLRPDGSVKVLDFGLARAMADETGTSASAQSPTITADYTRPGVVLGTAAYMSPEQARGRTVDRRSDIWSFGAVLYECLTGKVLFRGESATESMGAILHKEPEWSLLPPGTPPTVALLLRRCLAKDRNRRLQSIADARVELQDAIADPTSSAVGLASAALGTASPRRWATIGALALAVAVTAGAMWVALSPPEPFVQRYTITLPEDMELEPGFVHSFDVSRDGQLVVMAASSNNGPAQLYLRRADQLEPTPLALGRTEGAMGPTLSPDAQWVVYHQDETLKKISIDGGPAVTLTDFPNPTPMVGWSDDGWIYFFGGGGLHRVPENGGPSQSVSPQEDGRFGIGPQVLPGGAVLFQERGGPTNQSIVGIRPGASQRERIVENARAPRWSPTGHLLFVREGTLMAAAFDPIQMDPVVQPIPLIEGVMEGFLTAEYAITPSGALFHAQGSAGGSLDVMALVHVAMDGTVEPLPVQRGSFRYWRGSPDGRTIALVRIEDSSSFEGGLWVLDVERDVLTLLPTGATVRGRPLWSPDGDWLYYPAAADDGTALHRIRADGSAAGELLGDAAGFFPTSITGDGTRLYADRRAGGRGSDIVVVHLEEDFRVEDIITAPDDQDTGVISPDGAWLAYTSDDSGREQVYISSADGQGGRVQASRAGGRDPAWSPDGTKLYFNTDDTRMVVEVSTPNDQGSAQATSGQGVSPQDLQISPPSALFERAQNIHPLIELTPDGEGFLAISLGDQGLGARADEIIVTLNFSKILESVGSEGR